MTIVRTRVLLQNKLGKSEKTIGCRTNLVLSQVADAGRLCFLEKVVDDLRTVTQWSSNSCKRVASAGYVAVLYNFIAESNRSVATSLVLNSVIQVLINLAKFHETRPDVIDFPQWLKILVETMLHFQNYQQFVMVKVTVLLLIVADMPRAREEMRQSSFLIRKLKHAAQRLQKREGARSQRQSLGDRAVAVSSPSQPLHQSERYTPDWMLKTRKPVETFTPLQGLLKLFACYGIDHASPSRY
ncbi:unnamed protein product [Soboliphyme baturini]|uniref:MOR2-PAG1_N domain-containing protein n=1 Tax=Soboliphyme baturini TaxID=241478 RepID=A0A183JAQ6_9BILA|nr:unnamed protein product [Soboliphyme baturini]